MSKLNQALLKIAMYMDKVDNIEELKHKIKLVLCGYSLDCELDSHVRLERDEYYLGINQNVKK